MKHYRSKFWTLLSASLALAFVLSACAPAAQPTAAPAPAATTAPAQPTAAPKPTEPPKAAVKDTLVVAINGQPSRLQPQQPVGRLNELVNGLIFDSPTSRDPQGKLVPSMAESWKRIDDTTWEFKLRPNLKFHNGDPVTPADVKFTYEELVVKPEAKSPHLTFLQTIKEVKVVDDTTFQIITNKPDVLLPSRLFDLYGSVVPEKYYKSVGDAKFDTAPIGSGPFKFVEWVKDSHITLAANENYWGGKPAYNKLVLRFITDDAARMAAVLAGEVDIASNVPPARVEELKGNAKLDVRAGPSSRYYFLVFDSTKKPFSDVKVRQAVNLAIDRDALVKGVSRGYGTPIASVFIPQTFGYDANLKPVYDVNKAKQLLAEAGYPNGLDIEFDSFTGSIVDHSKVAEAIAAQLEKAGIRVKLNVAEFGVFGPKRLAHQTAPMYIYSLGDWAFDMGVHLKSYVEGSQGYYHIDKDLGDKIDKMLGMFDENQRKAAYQEVEKAFYDQALYGSVYQVYQIWVASKNVAWDPQPDEMLRFHLAKPK